MRAETEMIVTETQGDTREKGVGAEMRVAEGEDTEVETTEGAGLLYKDKGCIKKWRIYTLITHYEAFLLYVKDRQNSPFFRHLLIYSIDRLFNRDH